jgi:hypothetical protein
MIKLEFHPLADIFPLLGEDELEDLAKDIKANGLQEPIVLYEGKILDGRNRYRGCELVGVEPRFETYEGDNPRAYVISLNVMRRHLDQATKRALIADELRERPETSNRQIAKSLGVKHDTVGSVRAGLVATGQIGQLEKTIGADGKARTSSPARKLVQTPLPTLEITRRTVEMPPENFVCDRPVTRLRKFRDEKQAATTRKLASWIIGKCDGDQEIAKVLAWSEELYLYFPEEFDDLLREAAGVPWDDDDEDAAPTDGGAS